MTELTYAELVRELFPRLTGGVRWGLERTQSLLESVGSPHLAYRTIHIGGTNGKGSVAATVASILQESGVRTGLYTSPHLCTFRERMRLDGAPLSEDAILAAARRLWPGIQSTGATFFEATTAIAFLALAEAGAEWLVAEVGLGGRLDATNVVRPEVVALTNVALDHVDLLGPTVADVAREKAGIIKPGVPVVTAERNGETLRIFRERAASVGAPLHRLTLGRIQGVRWDRGGTRFRLRTREWGDLDLSTPLIGRHQAANAALAVSALELLPPDARLAASTIVNGMARVHWPGRLQIERVDHVTWVFDAAHNPAGAAALADALAPLDLPRPIVLLAGILGDKDWRTMLPPLERPVDVTVLTVPPSAPEHRRWDPRQAATLASPGPVEVEPSFRRALERAAELARAGATRIPGPDAPDSAGAAGTVLVTGSLHTVGDALLALGLGPGDPAPGFPAAAVAGSTAPAAESDATLPVGAAPV